VKWPGTTLAKGIVFYVHGGGYVSGDARQGIGMLCVMGQKLGMLGFAVNYPKLPQNAMTICDIVMHVLKAYAYLVTQLRVNPKRIVLIGESAGGNCVLLMCQYILEHRLKEWGLPLACVPLSPLVDASLSYAAKTKHKDDDVVLSYDYWKRISRVWLNQVNEQEIATAEQVQFGRKDARVSPMYGKWTGLCPLYFAVGRNELFYNETVEAAKRAKAYGVREVRLDVDEHLFHIFNLFATTVPESRDVIVRICDWIRTLQPEETV